MKKIALITENAAHDGQALKALLKKKFTETDFEIIPILKKMTGDKLKNLRKVALQLELDNRKYKKFDVVVVALDLDGLPSEALKIQDKKDWFSKFEKLNSLKNGFFLMIFELESLILADIETFNNIYNTQIKFKSNPLFKANPKEFLKQKTAKAHRKYSESEAPEIFTQLNFQALYNHHKGEISFQTFINELEKLIQ